jgi:hypothetical protein
LVLQAPLPDGLLLDLLSRFQDLARSGFRRRRRRDDTRRDREDDGSDHPHLSSPRFSSRLGIRVPTIAGADNPELNCDVAPP